MRSLGHRSCGSEEETAGPDPLVAQEEPIKVAAQWAPGRGCCPLLVYGRAAERAAEPTWAEAEN